MELMNILVLKYSFILKMGLISILLKQSYNYKGGAFSTHQYDKTIVYKITLSN